MSGLNEWGRAFQAYEKAFRGVTVAVVRDSDGAPFARILFKQAARGGPVRCWVFAQHFHVSRGVAGGSGYDKRDTAASNATRMLREEISGVSGACLTSAYLEMKGDRVTAFLEALENAEERGGWNTALVKADFDVWVLT